MTIALAFHILIALISVAFTTYLWVQPSKRKLHASYVLAGLTLSSGTYLVVAARTHLLEACAMGFAYLIVVSVGILAARRALTTSR